MNFIPKPLEVPLFLYGRNRIKLHQSQNVRNYITNKRNLYAKNCEKLSSTGLTAINRLPHTANSENNEKLDTPQCVQQVSSKQKRDLIEIKPWHLPPNIYNVPQVLYGKYKGSSGAYWPKLRKTYTEPMTAKGKTTSKKFYEFPSEAQRMTNSCNYYKGIFLKNARERCPTDRCMITDIATCYRDPNAPGPATYYSQLHELDHNVSKKTKIPRPKPHIFLRHTSVPVKANSIHARNISFQPGPGSYETRFSKLCSCKPKQLYTTDLQLNIDREKRYKFRRLPYMKIKAHLYCAPEWQHVAGHGHRHIFKTTRNQKKQTFQIPKLHKLRKSEQHLQLYPDSRYINMITNPERQEISLRTNEPQPKLVKDITYNCLIRRIKRRPMRNNKKIAFLSGQERFNDLTSLLTNPQLEASKKQLPQERRLRNQPITRVALSDIKSRFLETPKHMQAVFQLELRKRLFKFQPLPMPKVLVRDHETTVKTSNGFYNQQVDIMDFLKKHTSREI